MKLRKKGILILPKAVREAVGFKENSEVLAEVRGDSVILRPLEPRIVDVDPALVDKILKEERSEWGKKLERTLEEISS